MTRHLHLFAAAALAAIPAMAQTAQTAVPDVPAVIKVPDGNVPYLNGQAVGTQNYVCMTSATGYAWKFIGPQATLFVTFQWMNTTVRQQITTHYLSRNPGEGGTARPAWQSSSDTSAVWGKAIASSSDPAYVAAGAIPWLLLEKVGTQQGPMGGTMMTATAFLQRINTTGGMMPATGCTGAANVGDMAFVPYTAGYVFYKKK